MKKLFFGVLFTAWAGTASAFSADEFYTRCWKSSGRINEQNKAVCLVLFDTAWLSITHGALSAAWKSPDYAMTEPEMKRALREILEVCLPAGATRVMITQAFGKHLTKNPEKRTLGFPEALHQSLKATYPCH